MIEEIVNRIQSGLNYRRRRKALGRYGVILNTYGVDSEEEVQCAEQIVGQYKGADVYIRLARRLQMECESKEEKNE